MNYKSHPLYDRSNALDWLSLPDERHEQQSGADKAIIDALLAHKQRLCEVAFKRIAAAAGETYLAERPYPDVNEFIYFPIGNSGYRVYVEYAFFQQPDENTYDSDVWWVIINCPDAGVPDFPGRPQENVIGLGWVVM